MSQPVQAWANKIWCWGMFVHEVPDWIVHVYFLLVDTSGLSKHDVLHCEVPMIHQWHKNVCVRYNTCLMVLWYLEHFFYRKNIASPTLCSFLMPISVNLCQRILINSVLLWVFLKNDFLLYVTCIDLFVMFVCRQYRSSSQMLVCFCWQWIAVTIKYYMNIKILVLCFQMFYILIRQIAIWQVPEPLNLRHQSLTDSDNVFGWSFWCYCIPC